MSDHQSGFRVPTRAICLDTETTGLSPATDRVVQIAGVELLQGVVFGERKCWLLNPGILIPAEATKVHAITDAMVADAPGFAGIADELLSFVGTSPIIAHNASFDMAFLSAELARADRPAIEVEIIDTLPMLRRRVGSGRATLDAACKIFGISLERRKDRHDALIDAELLGEVFGYLTGVRKRTLLDILEAAPVKTAPRSTRSRDSKKVSRADATLATYPDRGLGAPRDMERAAHAIWRRGFGLPLLLAAMLVTGCAASGDTSRQLSGEATQTQGAAAARVEIREDAKDITPGDRIVRVTERQNPRTPEPGEASTPRTPLRDEAASRDIVDARALAVLATLLGGVPATPILGDLCETPC